MHRFFRSTVRAAAAGLMIAAAILALVIPPVHAQATSQVLYDFTVTNADTLSPSLGFNIRYQRVDESPGWHQFNLGLWAAGHQAFSEEVRDIDHMEIGADIFGNFYFSQVAPLPGPVQDHYWEMFQRSAATQGAGLTAVENEEIHKLTADVLASHDFIGYSLNAKLVMDQEATNRQAVFGADFNAELSALSKILDAPFKPTRGAGDPFIPEPAKLSIGAEYVNGLGDRHDAYPQVAGKFFFGTRLADKLYPQLRVKASYASDEITRPDFVYLADASVLIPVSELTSVAVGYVAGYEAPNYEYRRGLRIGFNVANW